MAISRRQFLSRSSAVIVAGTMAAGKVFGANEKVNMAVIGFNARGGNHIEGWRTPARGTEFPAVRLPSLSR